MKMEMKMDGIIKINTNSAERMRFSLFFLLTSAIASPFPTPNITTSFSCTTVQQCDIGFPGCYQNMRKGYTVDYAFDATNLKQSNGPTSLLSSSENNQVVDRWDLGFQYGMWIAGKGVTKTILNCSRLHLRSMSPTSLKQSFLGYSYRASNASNKVPCSLSPNSTSMGSCDEWIWNSQFGCGNTTAHALGREPETWRLSRLSTSSSSSADSFVLASMSNEIFYPKLCQEMGNPAHIGASIDYTQDWKSNPVDTMFDVPSDAECPLATDATQFYDALHPSLMLIRRPFAL